MSGWAGGYSAPLPAAVLSYPSVCVCMQMRETYGKMVYLLMDSSDNEIQELLGFK